MSFTGTFPRKLFAIAAVIVAFAGICDAVYLTIHHYTAEPVPCGLTGGCEMVLTSPYATVAGIPLAAFGVVGYIFAFALAILAVRGRSWAWILYGLQATLMAGFSGWLIYVQAEYIHAFCQFCLLSAATSTILFLIFLASLAFRGRSKAAETD